MIFKVINHRELLPDMQLVRHLGRALYARGFIIAGGSIWCAFRNIPLNDIDIFSTIKGKQCNMDTLIECLHEAGYKDLVYENAPVVSTYAINYEVIINGITYKIQFINPEGKATGTPSDIVRGFDIQNVALYINERGNVASTGYDALPRGIKMPIDEYIGSKKLTYNTLLLGYVSNPYLTTSRVIKYKDRGLEVDHNTVFRTLHSIQKAKDNLMTLHTAFNTPKGTAKGLAHARTQANIDALFGTSRVRAIPSGLRDVEDYADFIGLNSVGFTEITANNFNSTLDIIIHRILSTMGNKDDLCRIVERNYSLLESLYKEYQPAPVDPKERVEQTQIVTQEQGGENIDW